MALLVYGSLGPDLVYSVPRLPRPGDDVPAAGVELVAGGGGGNVASALAAWGYQVRLRGNELGDGVLGHWVRDELIGRGVDLAADLIRIGAPTPVFAILVTPDGERAIIGSDYSGVQWSKVSSTEWDGVAAAVVDGYSGPAGAEVAQQAEARRIPMVGVDVTGETAGRARIVVWSKSDHPEAEEAAQLARTGPAVVLTDGPRAVTVFQDRGMMTIKPPPVRPGDTTGAGDVFAAACAAGIGDGLPLLPNVRRAAHVSARFVGAGRAGGPPPL